jgi:hypothetical protein
MEINEDTEDGIQINTPKQKENQKVINLFFSKFKKHELSKDDKNFIKNKNDIFSVESIKPSLALFDENNIINKNNCFIEADKTIKNYFPLVSFKLNFPHVSFKLNNNNHIMKIEEKNNDININLNATTIKGGRGLKKIISDPNTRWIMEVDGKKLEFSSSFELFDYLTNYILPNKRLDNYIIKMTNINNKQYISEYKGGELYINLMKYLPLYFKNFNIDDNTAENYNANNNNLNGIHDYENEYEQESDENNYLVEQNYLNPNNDLNFGFNANS